MAYSIGLNGPDDRWIMLYMVGDQLWWKMICDGSTENGQALYSDALDGRCCTAG
jgi:hypothetical protein